MNLPRLPVVANLMDRWTYGSIVADAEPKRYAEILGHDSDEYRRHPDFTTIYSLNQYTSRLHLTHQKIATRVFEEGRGVTREEIRSRLQKFLDSCKQVIIADTYLDDPWAGDSEAYQKGRSHVPSSLFPDPCYVTDVYRLPYIPEDAVRRAA